MSMDEIRLTDKQIYDMEVVAKNLWSRYNYPVAFFGKRQITFNTRCAHALKDIRAVQWFATGDYIIGLPAREDDPNAFYVRKNKMSNCYATALPASFISSKRIQQGCYYKVFKYRDGIAFKRFEPIDPYRNERSN